ncbi:hypothetical protein FNV43_RR01789 [Rhamnella rubrinervis]|uniref:Transcription repressor n=1 Tax=Rhamnella rubrinervis TaxID=2594499 RepID=A0A8K0MSM0_9ROSA|nr:hypothetical protein FNV43_RR01789 [Rhamnella rubrinervis]
MSNNNIFWKHFQLCSFFNFKCLPTIQSSPPPPPPPPPDHQDHNNHSSSMPTTSLLNNFNSLYHHDLTTTSHSSTSKSFTPSDDHDDFFSSSDESDSDQSPPDFAAVFASQRFFFSSPGHSNSIVESPDIKPGVVDSETTTDMDIDSAGGVRVPKFSINPYDDFRRSMQEMMEARDVLVDERSDLEYLHELLLCYLALNPKHTHKFIISAFTDLVINLLSSSSSGTRHHRRQDNVLRPVI